MIWAHCRIKVIKWVSSNSSIRRLCQLKRDTSSGREKPRTELDSSSRQISVSWARTWRRRSNNSCPGCESGQPADRSRTPLLSFSHEATMAGKSGYQKVCAFWIRNQTKKPTGVAAAITDVTWQIHAFRLEKTTDILWTFLKPGIHNFLVLRNRFLFVLFHLWGVPSEQSVMPLLAGTPWMGWIMDCCSHEPWPLSWI